MPFWERKKKENSEIVLDEWQKLANDPKYYTDLPESEKPNIQNIQKDLYHAFNCGIPSLDALLDSRRTMPDLISEAENNKEQAKLLEKGKNKSEAEQKYKHAGLLYWKAATLGLLRKEIRAKIDPETNDVELKDVLAYFNMAMKLGFNMPYQAVMKYPGIAREIVSDKVAGYQPKVQEKK